MLRLFRRAARLLFAAGAVGVAVSPPPALHAQHPPGLINSIQVTTSQMRLEAMKVEMALLADYTTYQLPLTVQFGDNCLELRGRIPDENTRRLALRVARQACYLPVQDALHVSPPQPVRADVMRRTARALLDEAPGDRVRGLEVQVAADGQVTLSGQAATVEDRVAASKALRGLPGCQCVVNALSVQPIHHGGSTTTVVTRDGQHTVRGVLPAGGPAPVRTAPAEAAPRPTPAASSVRSTAPPNSVPAGLPPAREVYVRLKTTNQVHPVMYVAPSSGYPTALADQALAVSVVSPPLPSGGYGAPHSSKPTLKGRVGLLERLRNFMAESEPAPTPPAPAVRMPAPAPVEMPAAMPATPAPAHAVAPAMPPAYADRSTPARQRNPVLSHAPAIRLAARPELAMKPDAAVPAPVVKRGPALPAAPTTAEPPALTPTSAQGTPRAAPVVPATPAPTSGPVLASLADPTPPVRQLSAAQIDRLVRSACGKLVTSVKVESLGPDGRLTVYINAAAGADQEIIKRLLGVPEIASSNHLRLQIQLPN